MLSKQRRLRTSEVQEVLARGRSRRANFLSVKFLQNQEAFRAAAVVSKKVAKTAVARNRFRRALYDALRESVPPSQGYAILFLQRVPPPPLRTALKDDLKKLLHV